MEPSLADGRLKTRRKGQATVRVAITGRSAHAGVDPGDGVSAATEAAHVALAAQALADGVDGTIVNVGVINAGELPNVVASSARLEIEVRADTDAEVQRVIDGIRDLKPRVAGAQTVVSVESDRPAMPRLAQTDRLLQAARDVGLALDCEILEGATGGVSEGNFTQAVGTPTLDGLGACGLGAHSPREQILASSLFLRTALLAGLLVALGRAEHG
jgi:glutamate carboxypeptidase